MNSNIYCHKLNLPVQINHGIEPIDYSKEFFMRFEPELHIGQELYEWLSTLGLRYITGGYFYTPANSSWIPHVDGQQLIDFCKINWRIGAPGSIIRWYNPLPDFELTPGENLPGSVSPNTNYSTVDASKLTEVYTIEHPDVCLFNPGRIHSFTAGPCAQHVVSIVIGPKDSDMRLFWEQGVKVFKNFIVE
jgi:hypothetical protein